MFAILKHLKMILLKKHEWSFCIGSLLLMVPAGDLRRKANRQGRVTLRTTMRRRWYCEPLKTTQARAWSSPSRQAPWRTPRGQPGPEDGSGGNTQLPSTRGLCGVRLPRAASYHTLYSRPAEPWEEGYSMGASSMAQI
jgi:hypothetical protein